jgi:hypothetical protein
VLVRIVYVPIASVLVGYLDMESLWSKKPVRKLSVNTLFAKTLELRSQQHKLTTSTIPKTIPNQKLYRSQSEHQLESRCVGEGGEGGTARGRSAHTSRRPQTARTARDPLARKTARSNREMISEIEARARNGLSSPRHICQDINTLPTEFLDWHRGRKSPRRSRSRSPSPTRPGSCPGGALTSRPVVNIIGCQQSQELILARADDRIRKQLQATELREDACTEQRNRILKLIADQETKIERAAFHIKRQREQTGWLKIITIVGFMSQIKPMVLEEMQKLKAESVVSTAGVKIAHSFVSWHQRKHAQRYLQMFRSILGSNNNAFLVRFRILYKRMCVKRIRSFFSDCKDRNKVSSMVHHFLHSVRLIQGAIRNFIACRLEKIRSTIIIWDRLELQYIMVRDN